MNAVTCQASAYLYTLMPACAAPGAALSLTAGVAPAARYPTWGTHTSTPTPEGRFDRGEKAETTPKQITGGAASSDRLADDRCSGVCRSGNSGGRLVIAVRRLSPAAATATTSSVISYGRREPAAWYLAISN